MSADYYELHDVEDRANCGAFQFERSRQLCDAIVRHRDYSLLGLFASLEDGTVSDEILVVDVECHGVPSRNPCGILFRERLALSVPADSKRLVSILALRRGFPTLIHQNQAPIDGPANLCLYFEPPPSVLRTWTPQKFLRRIQWWLEESAKGTLHATDQPVEHLFFASPFELVLPWNFDELRRHPDQRFVIRRGGPRPDRGEAYFVIPVSAGETDERAAVPIELVLPPIVQGQIERDPMTLGELSDLLSARGVDLLDVLDGAVHQRVDERGATEPADAFSVIMLHVPIARASGAEPERVTRRAFLVHKGPLRLGELTGTVFQFQNKYFREAGLGQRPSGPWRSEPVLPMEVLRFNTASAARRQSGITDPGPAGVLVGAGSLGAAMLDLWGRGGWGEWTAIDKDHVRPHNIARHVAYAQHVGLPKAYVVAQLHDAIAEGASRIVPVYADASNLSNGEVRAALTSSKLVVDASTTLEYPRLASIADELPRHISVFITPNANGAVLLAEDPQRSIRLRTLEAQYYRAVIEEPWGEHHLDGNLGTFWSGASCRDISGVLPYSRVLAHAGLLAEQVQRAAVREAPMIRVWSRDPDVGAVAMHEVPVAGERSVVVGTLSVFIDAGLEDKLRSLRQKGLPEETGGILLGYHDFNVNAVVLVDALPAPVDSLRSTAFFERGIQGLATAVNNATRRTAGIVGYVGEWHSHPEGYSAAPSGQDLFQLVYLALGMADDGLPAVSVIVSETDVQIIGGVVKHVTVNEHVP
jgi:integrative and conjugative element protein (TIGR02256 family)